MTQIGSVYAQALYSLAKEESRSQEVLEQLKVLKGSFSLEPDFIRLLSSPKVSKEERCRIVDESFRGKVHPYVLNFMKLLTEKGYMRHFEDCCKAYQALYNQDNGILVVQAVTAVALNESQSERLSGTLARITGKTIELENRIDPDCLGGIRVEYDGKCVDDTVAHRLEEMGRMLKNTVL